MILFVLWLITSSYAVQLGVYPSNDLCAVAGIQVKTYLDEKPRAVLGDVACIPTMIPPDGPGRAPPERFDF